MKLKDTIGLAIGAHKKGYIDTDYTINLLYNRINSTSLKWALIGYWIGGIVGILVMTIK